MKKVAILIIVSTLFGCSVIGGELGEVVDKTTGEDKYQDKYAIEGLEIDIEILEELFLEMKKEEGIDDRACTEPGTHQVCTFNKGCWCKKT